MLFNVNDVSMNFHIDIGDEQVDNELLYRIINLIIIPVLKKSYA
jgi:hypothetical protein